MSEANCSESELSALLCLIKQRKALVDCEISDYATENEGNLVSANLDILIKKKQAYEWVISDLQQHDRRRTASV